MVVKRPPEQDKVEKNYSHNNDSGLDAETWVLNSTVTWSVMQLSDNEERREWRWTGMHVEVSRTYCFIQVRHHGIFAQGVAVHRKTVIMHVICTYFLGVAEWKGYRFCHHKDWGFTPGSTKTIKLWASYFTSIHFIGLYIGGASGKEPTCQCRRRKRWGFDPWVGKIPWRRAWQPTPVFFFFTHSSILAWRIPWTEEPGRLQSLEYQRVRHHWSDLACTHTFYCSFFRNEETNTTERELWWG